MSDVTEINKALQDFIVSQSNVITGRMNDGMKQKTPVDTGRAQAGWVIQKLVAKVGDTALIENQVPYIGWLNYGTPYMDGNFMVERTIQEVQRDYQ